jgi:hypothetical protein
LGVVLAATSSFFGLGIVNIGSTTTDSMRMNNELTPPIDRELEQLLKKNIELIKFEDEKIAKVRNDAFWLYQIAGMRALREGSKRIYDLYKNDK